MNRNKLVSLSLVALVILITVVVEYHTLRNRPTPSLSAPGFVATPTDWQSIDADSFTVSLPPGWTFNKLQGIDSYIGEFKGDGATLMFDFGWYSNSLPEESDPGHVVTYETVDGHRAKLVVPKVTGNGTTGVYFSDLGNQNKLTVEGSNLTASQQETVLQVFRTIKFKK